MNTRKLLLKLSKRFPKRYAKFYHDHVGLMTGKLPEEVHNILKCHTFDDDLNEYLEWKKSAEKENVF